MTPRRNIISVFSRIRRRVDERARRLTVHSFDYQRDLVYVYRWNDVVAWPIAVARMDWFRRGDRYVVLR